MEEKNKGKSIGVGVIFLVGILIIAVCVITVALTNNDTEDTAVQKIELKNNFNDVSGIVIKSVYLNTAEEKGYTINYLYGGANQGKLFVGEMEDELIEIKANKAIKDIETVTTFNNSFDPEEENDETLYVSILYVLFEDGTIGRINTNDIKNGNYSLIELDSFNNIEYLDTFEYRPSINAGAHDRILCGIEKDTGKVIKIDYNFCP